MEEAKVSFMGLQLLIQCVHKLSQIESLNTIIYLVYNNRGLKPCGVNGDDTNAIGGLTCLRYSIKCGRDIVY